MWTGDDELSVLIRVSPPNQQTTSRRGYGILVMVSKSYPGYDIQTVSYALVVWMRNSSQTISDPYVIVLILLKYPCCYCCCGKIN